jgi:predicted Ser/Thr protein kinase
MCDYGVEWRKGAKVAEFELKMKYTNPATQNQMRFLAVCFPVWGIAAPVLLALFILLLLRLPANIPLAQSLAIIVGLTLFIAFSALAAFVCDDESIHVHKDGLEFPLKLMPGLKFRAQRKWSDLVELKLRWHRNEKFAADEAMLLLFESGGEAELKLKDLQPKELEQFFIAFEACAYRCRRDAELPDLENAIQSGVSGNATSYTELWEKSLAAKFSGATFAPLEPGKVLQSGLYKVCKQLGFGGFSAVYLARRKGAGFVVLKECAIPNSNENAERAAAMFEREAEILRRLSHPNIAAVSDSFVEDGRQYIVMQHIEGIDLGRFILQHGPQSSEVVAGWLRQVANAAKYLHEQEPPIVHRDLTPDNLLLRPDGTVVLIDFGAAKEIVGSLSGTIIGKQAYVAPEQFKGKACPKSDVYSMGATAFFLLTGREPEPLTQSVLESAGRECAGTLAGVVRQCTELDAANRPDSHELEGLLTGESTEKLIEETVVA